MTEVVLGVSGGIASYKAAELLRLFTESGHSVRVVPTESSLNFVGDCHVGGAERQAGPGRRVRARRRGRARAHRAGRRPRASSRRPPPTSWRKAAHGLADDLLTNTLLTARCPVMFAPAMHTEMWENAATQANVATLRERGHVVLEPAVGPPHRRRHRQGPPARPRARSTAAALDVLAGPRAQDLAGRHVVVSAGGTREFLDPVRYLGNRSSGRQGFALAEAAVARGATRHGRGRQRRARRSPPAPTSCGSSAPRSCASRHACRGRRRRRRRDGRGAGRLPSGRRSSTPRSRRPPTASRRRSAWSRIPTSSSSWSRARTEQAPGHRRLRCRDR